MNQGFVMANGIIGMCPCKVKRPAAVNELRIFMAAAQLFFRDLRYKKGHRGESLFARAGGGRV